MKMIDEYWDEGDTPYSDHFEFWPHWLLQYYHQLPLGESIESGYLMGKSEQHILTPRYDIMSSLVTFVKYYHVTLEDNGKQLKINFQYCYGCLACSDRSGELLYTTLIHAVIYTLGVYHKELDQKFLL